MRRNNNWMISTICCAILVWAVFPSMVLADADFDDNADILDPDSQYKIALLYLNGDGVKRDKTTAVKWLELAAQRDYQDAKIVLASLQSGKELVFYAPAQQASGMSSQERKETKAESLFQQGDVYHQGIGVSRDYSKAAHWYRQAAQLGHAEAQFRLGELYKRGRGVDRSKKLATKWFQAAASQGHIKAKYFLNGCAFC